MGPKSCKSVIHANRVPNLKWFQDIYKVHDNGAVEFYAKHKLEFELEFLSTNITLCDLMLNCCASCSA